MSVTATVRSVVNGGPSLTPLKANASERLERLKAQAAHPVCRCHDGGAFTLERDRCERCFGYRGPETGDEGERS